MGAEVKPAIELFNNCSHRCSPVFSCHEVQVFLRKNLSLTSNKIVFTKSEIVSVYTPRLTFNISNEDYLDTNVKIM